MWGGNVRKIVARPWILMMGESDATILCTRVVQWRRLSSVSDNVNAAAMTFADTMGSKRSKPGTVGEGELVECSASWRSIWIWVWSGVFCRS